MRSTGPKEENNKINIGKISSISKSNAMATFVHLLVRIGPLHNILKNDYEEKLSKIIFDITNQLVAGSEFLNIDPLLQLYGPDNDDGEDGLRVLFNIFNILEIKEFYSKLHMKDGSVDKAILYDIESNKSVLDGLKNKYEIEKSVVSKILFLNVNPKGLQRILINSPIFENYDLFLLIQTDDGKHFTTYLKDCSKKWYMIDNDNISPSITPTLVHKGNCILGYTCNFSLIVSVSNPRDYFEEKKNFEFERNNYLDKKPVIGLSKNDVNQQLNEEHSNKDNKKSETDLSQNDVNQQLNEEHSNKDNKKSETDLSQNDVNQQLNEEHSNKVNNKLIEISLNGLGKHSTDQKFTLSFKPNDKVSDLYNKLNDKLKDISDKIILIYIGNNIIENQQNAYIRDLESHDLKYRVTSRMKTFSIIYFSFHDKEKIKSTHENAMVNQNVLISTISCNSKNYKYFIFVENEIQILDPIKTYFYQIAKKSQYKLYICRDVNGDILKFYFNNGYESKPFLFNYSSYKSKNNMLENIKKDLQKYLSLNKLPILISNDKEITNDDELNQSKDSTIIIKKGKK